MELTILNDNFEAIAIMDTYISAIWTERYDQTGDFELVLPMNVTFRNYIRENYYLVKKDTNKAMIIEDIDITTDVEQGKQIKVTGRSLESILDRRIILNKLSFSAIWDEDSESYTYPNLQDGVERIFNENIINPAINARRIDNFIFKRSEDPVITSLTFQAQFYGDNIYDVVTKLCQENQVGFKIELSSDNEFIFELYAGADRTYDQFENTYIVFSKDMDNLLSSSYYRSVSTFKNIAVVAGEDETENTNTDDTEPDGSLDGTPTTPLDRTVVTVGNQFEIFGIDRREIYVDASDITREIDEYETLTEEEYRAHLKKKGIDTLIANLEVEAFDGEIEGTLTYKYGRDFFMGDIIQIEDEYGNEGQAYIAEYIESHDSSGVSMYPTFVTLRKATYEITE